MTPSQIFDVHLLESTNFSPSRLHFSKGFNIKIMFWVSWFHSWDRREKTMFIHTNQPLITSFYIKKIPILADEISDDSALIWNFLSNGRVRFKVIGVTLRNIWRWLKIRQWLVGRPQSRPENLSQNTRAPVPKAHSR